MSNESKNKGASKKELDSIEKKLKEGLPKRTAQAEALKDKKKK